MVIGPQGRIEVRFLPRDNFRREREFRTRSAKEFERVGYDHHLFHAHRFSRRLDSGSVQSGKEVEVCQPEEVPLERIFFCSNCGKTIATSIEDRVNRKKVSCPKCNQMYKLHMPYVTHGGEIIQYEE